MGWDGCLEDPRCTICDKGLFWDPCGKFLVMLFGVHTDQGRNLDCLVMKSFCQLIDIVETRITSYQPSYNGQVGLYNTVILNFLRRSLWRRKWQWAKYLYVQDIRPMVNSSTGFTPNTLQLGHQVNKSMNIIYGLSVIRRFFENLLCSIWGCCSLNPKEFMWKLRATYMEHRSTRKDCMMWIVSGKLSKLTIWCIARIH